MTITDSRQRNGTLTLDGVDYACQTRAVKITPPEQGDDVPDEVLCGDVLEAEDIKPWKLTITAIQDFADADGLVNVSWLQQGEKVPFLWAPQGGTGPTYGGTVALWPLEVGGDVNKRLESDAEWLLDAKPTRTEAGG